jgi:hypothetical protein
MSNKKCSCYSGNSKGFRSSMSRTWDQNQIYIFIIPQIHFNILSVSILLYLFSASKTNYKIELSSV